MSLFQRYLQHPAPGTTGANGLVAANNPWGAGRATLLRNNARHLVEVAIYRGLWNSAGVESVYRAAQAGTGFTTPPSVHDIQWQYTRKTGGLALDLGTHYVWRAPASGRWPRLVVRFQAKVASTYTLGVVLAAAPGQSGPLQARASASDAFTDTSFAEKELALNLTDECLAPLDVAGVDGTDVAATDEHGRLYAFRAFLGGYVSSNSGSDPGAVVGITLALENPT